MNLTSKIHHLHRCWRYRLRSERDSLRWLLELDLSGRLALDVGANHGIYSYWMSKAVGPTGAVVAFEPQPECVEHLSSLRSAFKLNNLELVPHALSNTSEEKAMRRSHPTSGGATLEHAGGPIRRGHEQLTITSTTLDECFPAADRQPAIIKCDVEGHELSVFQGGQVLLERSHPSLLLECHHRQAIEGELFGFLEGLGYAGHFYEHGMRFPLSEFERVPYRKAGQHHRNYIFQVQ